MNQTMPIVERVRHPLKLRIASVRHVQRLTPHMVRITLHSPQFSDFVSLGYDDHVKLFFPRAGQASIPMPQETPDGLRFPDGERPEARDYTPRAYDNDACTLTLDFVLHGDGPASSWAERAAPGDLIGVGGLRGSFVVRAAFDWYLLIGDETALPAIGRRIEELPHDARVHALIEIADAAERQSFNGGASAYVTWVSRVGGAPGDPERLLSATKSFVLPQGNGYIFIAGESAMSKMVRHHLVDERGHNPDWIKAAGYWQSGSADFDDGHAH